MSNTEKSNQDLLKRKVAEAACAYMDQNLPPNSLVGVGTGSTVNYFIDELAKLRSRFVGAVASSEATRIRLLNKNIPVHDLNSITTLPIYIDGADEIDHAFHMIKGGGGALTREKIIASVAQHFVCICDESKLVTKLGAFPLPIEIIPMASMHVMRALSQLGGVPEIRKDYITDNGNHIIDVRHLHLADPKELESQINMIAGVVTCGLFAHRGADVLLLSTPNGVRLSMRKNFVPLATT